MNIQTNILRLIGTGVILFWLALQMQVSQGNTQQFTFYSFPFTYLPTNIKEQIQRAMKFYQRTSQQNGIYCQQLELNGSSWDMFIQGLITSVDDVKN